MRRRRGLPAAGRPVERRRRSASSTAGCPSRATRRWPSTVLLRENAVHIVHCAAHLRRPCSKTLLPFLSTLPPPTLRQVPSHTTAVGHAIDSIARQNPSSPELFIAPSARLRLPRGLHRHARWLGGSRVLRLNKEKNHASAISRLYRRVQCLRRRL